ncbi:hypothetical protein JNUCC64_18765 [Streptomyces sp. JNUCC 64]
MQSFQVLVETIPRLVHGKHDGAEDGEPGFQKLDLLRFRMASPIGTRRSPILIDR